jgi:hypothetical protein
MSPNPDDYWCDMPGNGNLQTEHFGFGESIPMNEGLDQCSHSTTPFLEGY